MFVFEFLNEYAQIINTETDSAATKIEVYDAQNTSHTNMLYAQINMYKGIISNEILRNVFNLSKEISFTVAPANT